MPRKYQVDAISLTYGDHFNPGWKSVLRTKLYDPSLAPVITAFANETGATVDIHLEVPGFVEHRLVFSSDVSGALRDRLEHRLKGAAKSSSAIDNRGNNQPGDDQQSDGAVQ
jgi:hypothetical protein